MPADFGYLMVLVLAATLLASWPAHAAREQTAEAWLLKLGPALNMTTYRGIFVYSRGDQVNSMMIAHRYRNGQVEERLVPQDGASGEILRKGNRVICVLPDQGRIQLDRIIPSGPFAEAIASPQVPVGAWYQPEILGEDRVAGYPAMVIGLQPRDENRYSYRLWLEKETGLLLKSHVRLGDEVLERFQFTMLEITDELPDSEFEIRSDAATKTFKSALPGFGDKGRMEGWSLGWRPDGFMPAAAPMARRGQAAAFSDGLATFSVFVEPAEALDMPQGASRIGATTVYMHYTGREDGADGFLVTVVGEIPPPTAMRVAQSVVVNDRRALTQSQRD
ncbi:MucB/RseB C-terminal domain-containing protein [Marinobacter daqiaonensis]|nr:MucB/RseB C-terminal domain-containing protein [Marinobacter daqiaonensis]